MIQTIGRPRNAEVGAALIRAAEELILDKGFAALSVEAVAARAGTTRPAFYRRFDGIPALLLALLMQRFRIDLDVEMDTGNLRTDLEAIQSEQKALFGEPFVRRSLAGFLDSLQSNEQLRAVFLEQFLLPRRHAVAHIIRRAEERGEIPPCPDVEYICDLLTGPLVLRVVMPGLQQIDDELMANTVHSALETLGYRAR